MQWVSELEDRAFVGAESRLPQVFEQLRELAEGTNENPAALYGRADEIIRIGALPAGWLREHLPAQEPENLVIEYATWGWIPRYWEARADYPDHATAVRQLVLSPRGLLHEEPNRLLLEDLRDTVQSSTILAFVASGVHKISERGGRLGKPPTDLSRPLQRLIDMGYLRRETPYSTKPANKKRSFYKVSDPFFALSLSFRLSQLVRTRDAAYTLYLGSASPLPRGLCRRYLGELCRRYSFTTEFNYPARWWGKDAEGRMMELDMVAESYDGKTILVGECKWSQVQRQDLLLMATRAKARRLPFYKNQKVLTLLFCKNPTVSTAYGPTQVFGGLYE